MPVTNGVEFLRRVRERYPDLPFVPFTGEGSEDIASDATRGLVTAESVESVAERTVEATREVLGYPINGVRIYDGEHDALVRRALETRLLAGTRLRRPRGATDLPAGRDPGPARARTHRRHHPRARHLHHLQLAVLLRGSEVLRPVSGVAGDGVPVETARVLPARAPGRPRVSRAWRLRLRPAVDARRRGRLRPPVALRLRRHGLSRRLRAHRPPVRHADVRPVHGGDDGRPRPPRRRGHRAPAGTAGALAREHRPLGARGRRRPLPLHPCRPPVGTGGPSRTRINRRAGPVARVGRRPRGGTGRRKPDRRGSR